VFSGLGGFRVFARTREGVPSRPRDLMESWKLELRVRVYSFWLRAQV